MMFQGLDSLLCNVVTVIVGGNELIVYSSCRNFVLVGLRNFIIEDLMLRENALGLHAGKKLSMGGY